MREVCARGEAVTGGIRKAGEGTEDKACGRKTAKMQTMPPSLGAMSTW